MSSVITKYEPPPIPVRGFDWHAYIDGQEEVTGYGFTELEAVTELAERLAAVIEQISKQVNNLKGNP
jgi:hypothetical protein